MIVHQPDVLGALLISDAAGSSHGAGREAKMMLKVGQHLGE
jgi:hypothetical protein